MLSCFKFIKWLKSYREEMNYCYTNIDLNDNDLKSTRLKHSLSTLSYGEYLNHTTLKSFKKFKISRSDMKLQGRFNYKVGA